MSNESSIPPAATPATRSWSVLINSAIVMIGFVLSRLLGLVRDGVINAHFGTSPVADVYAAAFKIPDFLYLVIIGGALGSAFIPVFSELYTKGETQRAWHVTNAILNIALILLAVMSLIVALLARPLISLLFQFTPAQIDLATYLTRLFLLSPLLLGLGGLTMATLNGLDRFTLPALAPAAYNLAIIGGALVLAPWFGQRDLARYASGVVTDPTTGARYAIDGVAWGVVLGAIAYLVLQLPGLWRVGFRYRPIIDLRDRAVRRIGVLMGPRVFGQAALQINIIAMSSFASIIGNGRIRALDQAYQLMLLPHGIFALSLATVMFPALSRAYASGDLDALGSQMRSTLRSILWTIIPSAVGLGVLSVPLVRLLFQRGLFDAESTRLVASALIIYATALPAFAVSEVLIRTFYAMQDTRTPVMVGIGVVLANIALSAVWIGVFRWGHIALASAFSITNNLEAFTLVVLLRRRLGPLDPHRRLRRSLRRSLLGAAVMGGVLALLGMLVARTYPFVWTVAAIYNGTGVDARALVLYMLGAIIVGIGVYSGLAALQGAEELTVWKQRLQRWIRR